MPIAPQDAARIEAAARAAQSRSTGQIVCVLARASSAYEVMPLVWSALLALAAPWPLLIFTDLSGERIFIGQLAVFLIAFAALSLPALRLRLTPRRLLRSNAHRAAIEQFVIRGVTRCAARNGVLIYVSLAERYARIIADEGAAKAISQSQWKAIVNKLTDQMRTGSPIDALAEAATRCGDLLAEHFPAEPGAAPTVFQRFHVL
jgi:putative membrane protein